MQNHEKLKLETYYLWLVYDRSQPLFFFVPQEKVRFIRLYYVSQGIEYQNKKYHIILPFVRLAK